MWRFFMVWLLLVAGVGAFVYQLKYEVVRQERQLARINRQIIEDQEAIHVLKAEWSYLNQPAQIEAAARAHLGLEPIRGRQFATVETLPTRQQVTEPLPVVPVARPVKPAPTPLEVPEESVPDFSGPQDEEDAPAQPLTVDNNRPMMIVRQPASGPRPVSAPVSGPVSGGVRTAPGTGVPR